MADQRIIDAGIKLLVAGEFYEDQQLYADIIRENQLERSVYLHTHFISDNEVRYYLGAADCVVQPYRNATQSGVTPLAYHFEKPMIVTNVGGLPSMVPDHKVGLVCEPIRSIHCYRNTLFLFQLEKNIPSFSEREKRKYDCENLLDPSGN
jgi:glycosyltransferase involved in cell wall biosynthesis